MKPRQAVSGPQFVDAQESQAPKIQSAVVVAPAPVKPAPATSVVAAVVPATEPAASPTPAVAATPAVAVTPAAAATTVAHADPTPLAPAAAETPAAMQPPAASADAARWSVPGLIALAKGDLSTARLFLARAAEAGDARAWVALADTYDPAVLTKLGVVGAPGDPQRARDYLGRAAAAGVVAAKDRTAALDESTGSVH